MPWIARNAISWTMVCASPASAEPIKKMTIEAWKNVLRPYRSPSLPHSGVDTVDASRYAVTTQDRWDSPCRSPAIVGSAVATIVWSSAASSIPSSSAPMMMRVRRWLSWLGSCDSTGAPSPGTLQHHRRARPCPRVTPCATTRRAIPVPPAWRTSGPPMASCGDTAWLAALAAAVPAAVRDGRDGLLEGVVARQPGGKSGDPQRLGVPVPVAREGQDPVAGGELLPVPDDDRQRACIHELDGSEVQDDAVGVTARRGQVVVELAAGNRVKLAANRDDRDPAVAVRRQSEPFHAHPPRSAPRATGRGQSYAETMSVASSA